MDNKPGITTNVQYFYKRVRTLNKKEGGLIIYYNTIEQHRVARRKAKQAWKAAKHAYQVKLYKEGENPSTSSKDTGKLLKPS